MFSTLLTFREMKIKTMLRIHVTSEIAIIKIPCNKKWYHTGETAGKRNPFPLLEGMQTSVIHLEISIGDSSKY